jgi:hypothetical protein
VGDVHAGGAGRLKLPAGASYLLIADVTVLYNNKNNNNNATTTASNN